MGTEERVRLELNLCECFRTLGQYDDASSHHARADEVATQADDASLMARCILAEAWLDVSPVDHFELGPRIAHLLPRLPESALALRARLYSLSAESDSFSGAPRREREAKLAIRLAKESGDPIALAHAYYGDAIVRWGDMDGVHGWLGVLQRLEDAAWASGDERLATRMTQFRVVALLERGDVAAAELLAAESDQRTRDRNFAFESLMTHVRNVALGVFRGDPRSRERISEIAARGAKIAPRFSVQVRMGQEIVNAAETRDQATLEACLDAIADLSLNDTSMLIVRTFFSQVFRRQRRDAYQLALERTRNGLPRNNIQLTLNCMLAELHAWFDNRSLAALAYELLRPFCGYLQVSGIATTIVGPVGYTLGRVAHYLGHARAAREHFEETRELCERLQSRPWIQRCDVARARLNAPYSRRGGIRP